MSVFDSYPLAHVYIYTWEYLHGQFLFSSLPIGIACLKQKLFVVDYSVLSSDTQSNIAYGAGSMQLQGANNDEEAGRCIHITLAQSIVKYTVCILL